jgi:photosystem II stability/assembly factor-like uncharacterized protein
VRGAAAKPAAPVKASLATCHMGRFIAKKLHICRDIAFHTQLHSSVRFNKMILNGGIDMKKERIILLFIVLATIALILCGCSGKTASEASAASSSPPAPEPTPASAWTFVKEVKLSSNYDIKAAGFANEDVGMTVGYAGETHYTKNGGESWRYGYNKSVCRYSLGILNENVAWSGGNGDQICMTSDGGEKWNIVGTFDGGGYHTHIKFADTKNGWVSTNKRLAASSDSGRTWTEIPLPESISSIAGIYLRTPEEGYVLSVEGQLSKTTDGGKTWTHKDLNFKQFNMVAPGSKKDVLVPGNVSVAEICFTDENNGMVVFVGNYAGEGSKTWFMETKDGGDTWTVEQLNPVERFNASSVLLTQDGKYLTLSAGGLRLVVLKHN